MITWDKKMIIAMAIATFFLFTPASAENNIDGIGKDTACLTIEELQQMCMKSSKKHGVPFITKSYYTGKDSIMFAYWKKDTVGYVFLFREGCGSGMSKIPFNIVTSVFGGTSVLNLNQIQKEDL